MPDMIVRLYALPPLANAMDAVAQQGVIVRRPLPAEHESLLGWLEGLYPSWMAEAGVALKAEPATLFVAISDERPIGFAAYDATCANFFGPMGVDPSRRNAGVGRALLLAALHAQREAGYAYAIIGGVGPAEFYIKTVAAQLIEGSTPGIYTSGQEQA